METKHTPGPWRLVTVVTTKGTHHDQAVSTTNGSAALTMIHDGSAEGQANATLATAAPDLLAACIDTLQAADEMGLECPNAEGLRAAIAKATGNPA